MLGICKATGDIDLVAAGAFNTDLHATIDSSDEPLVSVDCSGVTLMSEAGYRVLVDATKYAARRGHTLVIRNMSPSCEALMRLYDWDRELRFELLGRADERRAARGVVLTASPGPAPRVGAKSDQVDISEDDDGWWAECLICHSWISTNNETRGDAETAFGRHLESDFPHFIDEQSRREPAPPSDGARSPNGLVLDGSVLVERDNPGASNR